MAFDYKRLIKVSSLSDLNFVFIDVFVYTCRFQKVLVDILINRRE